MKIAMVSVLGMFLTLGCDTGGDYSIARSKEGSVKPLEKKPSTLPSGDQSAASKNSEVKVAAETTSGEPSRVVAATSTPGTSSFKATDDPVVRYVTNLYAKILSRAPDAGGLDYWVKTYKDNQFTCGSLVRAFISANVDTNIAVYLPGSTHAAFLSRAYTIFLGRNPDDDGFNYWLTKLATQINTRETVVETFINTLEFKTNCTNAGLKAI